MARETVALGAALAAGVAAGFRAGYARGLAGLRPDTRDPLALGHRFPYANGWAAGWRAYRLALPPRETPLTWF